MGRNGNNFAKNAQINVGITQKSQFRVFVSRFNTKLGVDSQARPMTLFIWGGVDSDEP